MAEDHGDVAMITPFVVSPSCNWPAPKGSQLMM